jgi:hypothetical protein
VRRLTGGTGYLSAHDQRLWFGLGTTKTVDRLEIAWPSGVLQSFTNVAAGTLLEVEEGIGDPRTVLNLHGRR